jgi:hypothetical protein
MINVAGRTAAAQRFSSDHQVRLMQCLGVGSWGPVVSRMWHFGGEGRRIRSHADVVNKVSLTVQ